MADWDRVNGIEPSNAARGALFCRRTPSNNTIGDSPFNGLNNDSTSGAVREMADTATERRRRYGAFSETTVSEAVISASAGITKESSR